MSTLGEPSRCRLPARYHRFILPLVLAGFMSAVVSAITLATRTGIAANFVSDWAGAWIASLIVAYPVLLVALPIVRWIVAQFVESPPGH